MRLSRCTHCALPVLELEGQFSKLDSLFIDNGHPPPETAGWWHARYNESGADAHLLPIQDAGLQTHMPLDIQFVHPNHTSHISLK